MFIVRYPAKQYAYALVYFTGCGHFNRSMRYKAKTKYRWSLSDKGKRVVNQQRVVMNP